MIRAEMPAPSYLTAGVWPRERFVWQARSGLQRYQRRLREPVEQATEYTELRPHILIPAPAPRQEDVPAIFGDRSCEQKFFPMHGCAAQIQDSVAQSDHNRTQQSV